MAERRLNIPIVVTDSGSASLGRLDKNMGAFRKSTVGASGALSSFNKSFAPIMAMLGAGTVFGGGIYGLTKLLGGFVDVGKEVDSMKIRLTALLGSASEGAKLFEDLADYAGKVPFALNEIMQSATTLAGIMEGGRDEIMEWMPLIGDLAAVTGLSFQETTEQVQRMLSAGAASADRFRERGVLAMLGFTAGVSYSVDETRKKLWDAWNDSESKFKGATAKLAETFEGTMTMFGDAWFQFNRAIADAGAWEALTQLAKDTLAELRKLERDGTLEEWAFQISNSIKMAIDAFLLFGVAVKDMAELPDILGPAFTEQFLKWLGTPEREVLKKAALIKAIWDSIDLFPVPGAKGLETIGEAALAQYKKLEKQLEGLDIGFDFFDDRPKEMQPLDYKDIGADELLEELERFSFEWNKYLDDIFGVERQPTGLDAIMSGTLARLEHWHTPLVREAEEISKDIDDALSGGGRKKKKSRSKEEQKEYEKALKDYNAVALKSSHEIIRLTEGEYALKFEKLDEWRDKALETAKAVGGDTDVINRAYKAMFTEIVGDQRESTLKLKKDTEEWLEWHLNKLAEQGASIRELEEAEINWRIDNNEKFFTGMLLGFDKMRWRWEDFGRRGSEASEAIAESMSASFTSAFSDIIMGTKDVDDAFAAMGEAIIKTILDIIAQLMVEYMILMAIKGITTIAGMFASVPTAGAGAVGGGLGGSGGFGAGIGGGEVGAGLGGGFTPHGGGIIGESPIPRFHSGGVVKPGEVNAILQTGEAVIDRSTTMQERELVNYLLGKAPKSVSGGKMGGLLADSPSFGGTAAGAAVMASYGMMIASGQNYFGGGRRDLDDPNSASVTVNLINQTGQQFQARQGETRYEGKKQIQDIILESLFTNADFKQNARKGLGLAR